MTKHGQSNVYTKMSDVLRDLDAATTIAAPGVGCAPYVRRYIKVKVSMNGQPLSRAGVTQTTVPVPLLERLIRLGYVACVYEEGAYRQYAITPRGERYRAKCERKTDAEAHPPR